MVVCLTLTIVAGCGGGEPDSLGLRSGTGLFDDERFAIAEELLGRRISYTVQFTGRQSPQDMNGSAFGLLAGEDATLPDLAGRVELSLTVPLAFGRATARSDEGRAEIATNLADVAAGEHDAAYTRVGQRLVDAGFGDAVLRLGHEFNGAWPPWSSRDNEELFVAAWRHVHGVMTAVSDDFSFDWTAMRPGWERWARDAYPGDEYVDIIGMDVYWRDGEWNAELFENSYERTLTDHLDFAIQRGKQVSYPEWAVTIDAPEFIEAMHDWFERLPEDGPGSLAYQAYFDSGEEFSFATHPVAHDRYLDLFG